jgi:CDP-diacylglycerol--serine O-phosphatidyltransferase
MGQSNWIYMWGALIPLILSNVLHMVLVKKNLWSALAKPINARAYGKNKTWRGVVFVSLVNAMIFCIIHWPSLNAFRGWEVVAINFFIGWMYGLAYVLFELPNSWLKRRLGIPAGGSPERFKGLFMLLDKTDSALGVSLVFCVLHPFSWGDTALFFITASGLHILFSWILYLRKIKKAF